MNRDSSPRASRDLRDVLCKRLLAVRNRGRVRQADRDDRNVERPHRGERARVKLVNRIARERSPFRKGDDRSSFFGAPSDLAKRRSAASPVLAVDEDRVAVLGQATKQRPVRDVVPADQHALKEREHDSDVERALVVGDDQCAARRGGARRAPRAPRRTRAEDLRSSARGTDSRALPAPIGGQRPPASYAARIPAEKPDEGAGPQDGAHFAHFCGSRLWAREALDLVAVSARGGITRTGVSRRSTVDAVPVLQSYAGVADRSRRRGLFWFRLNRVTDLDIEDVFHEVGVTGEAAGTVRAPVMLGGPVSPESGWILYDAEGVPQPATGQTIAVGQRIACSASLELLERIARGDGPDTCAMMLGYSGWGAGQLESEMKQGSWIPVDLDYELVFDTPDREPLGSRARDPRHRPRPRHRQPDRERLSGAAPQSPSPCFRRGQRLPPVAMGCRLHRLLWSACSRSRWPVGVARAAGSSGKSMLDPDDDARTGYEKALLDFRRGDCLSAEPTFPRDPPGVSLQPLRRARGASHRRLPVQERSLPRGDPDLSAVRPHPSFTQRDPLRPVPNRRGLLQSDPRRLVHDPSCGRARSERRA